MVVVVDAVDVERLEMNSTDGAAYPGVLPPPPGVIPNLVNPESIAWRLILASALCPAFAILFWALRLYTSRCIVRKIYTDDCEWHPFAAASSSWASIVNEPSFFYLQT